MGKVLTIIFVRRFNQSRTMRVSRGRTPLRHAGSLYLKQLAEKTRRGLRGRVGQGRSGGGNSYGYDIVRGSADEGERGQRQINVCQAAIIRRVFNSLCERRVSASHRHRTQIARLVDAVAKGQMRRRSTKGSSSRVAAARRGGQACRRGRQPTLLHPNLAKCIEIGRAPG